MTKSKKNYLDNNNESSNTEANISNSTNVSELSSAVNNSNSELSQEEYTIDPITGQKYAKPRGESEYIGRRSWKLPPLIREGFQIIWEVNKGNRIQLRIADGWEFVDPKTPGCEDAGQLPSAGHDERGNALHHRAMQMPEAKYLEMMARRNRANTEKENATIFNPALGNGKDFYIIKKDHGSYYNYSSNPTAGKINQGMDNEMAAAYRNAMR